MFCKNTGKQFKDGKKFCPYCGQSLTDPRSHSTHYSLNNSDIRGFTGIQNDRGRDEKTQYSMKWFKFVIYVQLFVSALYNFALSIVYFTGVIYQIIGVSAKQVYVYCSGLKIADYYYATCLLILSAGAIVIRMMLAKYKRFAPYVYILFLIAAQCIAIVYVILVGIIAKDWGTLIYQIGLAGEIGKVFLLHNIALPFQIVALIEVVVIAILNAVYFSKRKDLFVN